MNRKALTSAEVGRYQLNELLYNELVSRGYHGWEARLLIEDPTETTRLIRGIIERRAA